MHAPLSKYYQIRNTKTQTGFGLTAKEDAIDGVRTIQVAMPYRTGATDSKAFENLGAAASHLDAYFILDTRSRTRTLFRDHTSLEDHARELGIDLKLQPTYVVYSQIRSSWFDGFTLPLLLVPPLIAGIVLIGWIVRLRRTVPR